MGHLLLYLLIGILSVAFGVFATAMIFVLFRYIHIKILNFRAYLIERKIQRKIKQIRERFK